MKKRNPWMIMLVFVLALAVLACTCTSSLPGSGNSDENSGNSGNSGEVDNSGNSGDNGSSATMVRGLPVMSDASNKFDAEVGGTATVSYSTQASINEVVDFYKTELGNMGYTVSLEAVQEASNTAGLTFDGEMTIVLGVAPDTLNAGSLTVSITSTPK